MPATIAITRSGPVATVTLRRPKVHNALNPAMIAELTEAFCEEGARAETRVVLLTAEGKSFCAGADLNWMREAAAYTPEQNAADALSLACMLQSVYECPKPVIARVQGSAFGGGVGLVAACDLAVAVEPATFCFSEAKLGLVPAIIAPFVLQRMTAGEARRYMLTAAPVRADEARRIGLVTEVSESAEAADATIAQWVADILRNGPEALATCKRLLTSVGGPPTSDLLRRCAAVLADVRAGAEGREGVQAFLEKRAPRWIAGDDGVP